MKRLLFDNQASHKKINTPKYVIFIVMDEQSHDACDDI